MPARAALALCFALVGGPAVAAAPGAEPSGGASSGLYVECRGERTAKPTVILESGAFGTSADWDLVLPDLARDGKVCAYDRGGVGMSPSRPGGEDPASIAGELERLLDALGETAPVILVGHSNGALYIETFADLWPGRVAGLVYVNAVGSDDLDEAALMRALRQERCLANLAVLAADIGLAPLLAPGVVKAQGLTGEAAERKREALTRLSSLRVARDEDRAIIPGLEATRRLGGSPAAIPTVVIVGAQWPGRPLARAWRAAEVAPALRAQRAWILDAVGATHVSPLARDRAYIATAVAWLRSLPAP